MNSDLTINLAPNRTYENENASICDDVTFSAANAMVSGYHHSRPARAMTAL
jgi:hypothetical protein